jgi:hypothetical protein
LPRDPAERSLAPARRSKPIDSHLAIFGHLIESETAKTEPFGDDVSKTYKRPAADQEDVGRAGGERSLHRSTRRIVAMIASRERRSY